MVKPGILFLGILFALTVCWIDQTRGAETDHKDLQSEANMNPDVKSDGVIVMDNDNNDIDFPTDESYDSDDNDADLSEFAGLRTMAKRPSWVGKRSLGAYMRGPQSNYRYGKYKKNFLRNRYRYGGKPSRYYQLSY